MAVRIINGNQLPQKKPLNQKSLSRCYLHIILVHCKVSTHWLKYKCHRHAQMTQTRSNVTGTIKWHRHAQMSQTRSNVTDTLKCHIHTQMSQTCSNVTYMLKCHRHAQMSQTRSNAQMSQTWSNCIFTVYISYIFYGLFYTHISYINTFKPIVYTWVIWYMIWYECIWVIYACCAGIILCFT